VDNLRESRGKAGRRERREGKKRGKKEKESYPKLQKCCLLVLRNFASSKILTK
jgi:hypothetical protein